MSALPVKSQSSNVQAMAMDESALINVLRNSLYPGAADDSIRLVIGYCKASGLDPMQKPVHIVPMWDSKAKQMRDVVMPGIGLYRTQAARSGDYAGVSEPEFGPDVSESVGGVEITYPAWCRVVIKRRLSDGTLAEFAATERWKENYATAGKDSAAPNAMWKRRPYAQLAKCAEAQALRKAFPEIGAQPTADEMEGKVIEAEAADVTPSREEPKTLSPYPQDQFNENIASWRKYIEGGKANAEQIIAMVATKYILSEAQREAIKDLEKPEE